MSGFLKFPFLLDCVYFTFFFSLSLLHTSHIKEKFLLPCDGIFLNRYELLLSAALTALIYQPLPLHKEQKKTIAKAIEVIKSLKIH